MINNKILYWPGRGQDLEILKHFRKELETKGYQFSHINIKYDENELCPNTWEQVIENTADWWIGISLGASLLYYSLQYVEKCNRPKRITLINPFYSRRILSKEKGFKMENQWDFNPIDYKETVNYLDMVLSINDTKIPMYHGAKLLNNTICENKQIIFVNESHTIDNKRAQVELAKILGNKEIFDRSIYERYHYCNIYK